VLRSHKNRKLLTFVTPVRLLFVSMILPHLLLAQMPPGGTFTGTTGTTTSTSQSDTMPTPSVSDISGQNNPFLGSASTAKPVPGSIPITLLDAIDRGLRYNLGLYTSQIAQDTVAGARLRSLSDVLPNLSARAAESIQQINLAAFGFSVPGGPTIVGPFAVNDVRASVVSPLIDLTALNRYRSANQNVQAAQFNYKNARELVVITVGLSYLQALAAEARVGAVQAQLNTAETLYHTAVDQRNAGVSPAIDMLRAQVEMQAQQQRLLATKNSLDKEKLQLARVIGLPVGQEFTLAQKVPLTPAPPLTLEEAIGRALRDRPDYAVAQTRVRAAEFSQHAATSERLPSVLFNADYGVIGRNLTNAHGTFTVQGAIRVPIFEGGRIKGDILQANSTLSQRKAEVEDMRGRIEYEVRSAFLDLTSAAEQVRVAQSTLDLANQTLTQAQDRFRAGVTNNVEVVQAQEAVANSNDAFISSALQFNLAKLALARSLGVAERATKEFLGGTP
jgi:outer membrane protein TolC